MVRLHRLVACTLDFNSDNPIVQKNTYEYTNLPPLSLTADFSTLTTPTPNESFTVSAFDNPCMSGVTYEWDFGSGYSAGSRLATHTFTTAGQKTIKLRVSHSLYGSKEVTKTFNLSWPPIVVDICAKGVQQFSASAGVVSTYACAGISITPPAYATVFKVTTTDAQCADLCSYQWEVRNVGTQAWIPVPSGYTDQYITQKITGNTQSFEVRCIVTSFETGGSGSSDQRAVIVTP